MKHESEEELARRAGPYWAMGVVLEEVRRRGLYPLVLIAGNGEDMAILPCGPHDMAQVLDIIRQVAAGIDAGKVERADPFTPDVMGRLNDGQ